MGSVKVDVTPMVKIVATAKGSEITLQNAKPLDLKGVPTQVTLPVPSSINIQKAFIKHITSNKDVFYYNNGGEGFNVEKNKVVFTNKDGFSDFIVSSVALGEEIPDEPTTPTNHAGNVGASVEEKTVTIYRVYNPNSGEHFFTPSLEEKEHLVSVGWKDEGVGFTTVEKSDVPVYRLYNANGGEHHYTVSMDEKDSLVKAGWNDEGVSWYANSDKGVAVYRVYNPNAFANNHHYTTSKEEYEHLLEIGWNDESIAFYVIK